MVFVAEISQHCCLSTCKKKYLEEGNPSARHEESQRVNFLGYLQQEKQLFQRQTKENAWIDCDC